MNTVNYTIGYLSHNLKVIGSNPIPATSLFNEPQIFDGMQIVTLNPRHASSLSSNPALPEMQLS